MHFCPFGPKSIEFTFENQGKMDAIFGVRNTKFPHGKIWYFEVAEMHSIYLGKQSELHCISVHLAQKALDFALKTKVKWMRFSECEIPSFPMVKDSISRWRKCIQFTLEKQSEIQCISVHLAQKALNLALKTKAKWMRFSECEIPSFPMVKVGISRWRKCIQFILENKVKFKTIRSL